MIFLHEKNTFFKGVINNLTPSSSIMTEVQAPLDARSSSKKSLKLAISYRDTDFSSSMLHCRRSLEAVVSHLLIENKISKETFPKKLAKQIKFLELERPGKFFKVNRITSRWIHWVPEARLMQNELDNCIYLMKKILHEVFEITKDELSEKYTLFDFLKGNFSENDGALYLKAGA